MQTQEAGTLHLTTIRNIIFDFGGVICDLEIDRTKEGFKRFGPPKEGIHLTPDQVDRSFIELVEQFEKGAITPGEFRTSIREFYLTPPTDNQIDDTWNALLAGIPRERIDLLLSLSHHFRIFLLSNSNRIHYDFYLNIFRDQSGFQSFDDLFEKAYFSFEMGMIKPDPEIFRYVTRQSGLDPRQTLFIDDTLMHIKAAQSEGMQAYHLAAGEDIVTLFGQSK